MGTSGSIYITAVAFPQFTLILNAVAHVHHQSVLTIFVAGFSECIL